MTDSSNVLEFDQFLSFTDLEKVDGFTDAWKSQDEEKFIEILYKNGMDKRFGYQLGYSLHRPRTSNQVEYGLRITFKERQDKEFEPYRDVRDIARTDRSSVVRAGMVESLNLGMYLGQIIEDELSKHVRYLEMKSEEKKGKE